MDWLLTPDEIEEAFPSAALATSISTPLTPYQIAREWHFVLGRRLSADTFDLKRSGFEWAHFWSAGKLRMTVSSFGRWAHFPVCPNDLYLEIEAFSQRVIEPAVDRAVPQRDVQCISCGAPTALGGYLPCGH